MEKYLIEYYLRCDKPADDKADAERILAYMQNDSDYKDMRIIHLIEDKEVK